MPESVYGRASFSKPMSAISVSVIGLAPLFAFTTASTSSLSPIPFGQCSHPRFAI
jgi:hypothetical protein